MDRMVYLAASGARQLALRQATNSHNLANLSTPGFRADLDNIQALPVYGPGHPSRVYASNERAGVSFDQGSIMYTGRELDVAINGDGFLVVQASDGTEAYTRAGNLRVNETGLLQTSAGHLVLGDGGPIAMPPYQSLQIGSDGTISIVPVGQAGSASTTVDRVKLVRPDHAQLEKGPDGLLRLADGAQAQADASVQLSAGAIESSNVNAVEALVTMIELARQFEMNVKLMAAARENDASASRLLSIS